MWRKINDFLIQFLRQKFCEHDWQYINFLIYSDDLKIKEDVSEIRCGWFFEMKCFMESIGASGIWPYFTKECMKCEKQGRVGMDTLVKATFPMYLLEENK